MDSTPNFPGNHALGGSPLAGGEKRRSAQTRRLSLWHLCHVSALLSSQFHCRPPSTELAAHPCVCARANSYFPLGSCGVCRRLLWVSALSEPHQTDQPVALSLGLDPLPALCSADDPLDWLFASV